MESSHEPSVASCQTTLSSLFFSGQMMPESVPEFMPAGADTYSSIGCISHHSLGLVGDAGKVIGLDQYTESVGQWQSVL